MTSNPADHAAPARGDGLWLWGFSLARVAFAMEQTSYSAAIGLLTVEWGMSAGQAGAISSAHHIGFLASLFTVGFLADRFGARRTYLLSSGFAAASALAFAAFARDYSSAFFLHGLMGLCSGGSYIPALALLAQRYPSARRGRAIGFYISATVAGYGLSLAISSLMIAQWGWRAAFWATCSAPLVGMVLGAAMLRGVPNVIPDRGGKEHQGNWLAALVRNRAAMIIIFAYVFHAWELLGVWAWLPYFLAGVYGGAGQTAFAVSMGAAFTALGYLVGVAGPMAGGILSDRLGRRRVIWMLAALGGVVSITLGWLAAAPFLAAVALTLIGQFLWAGDSPVLSTALTEVVPERLLGAAYALRSALGFGAGALATWVFGLVLDWGRGNAAVPPPATWAAAFSLMGLGGLLAAGLILLLPRNQALVEGGRTARQA